MKAPAAVFAALLLLAFAACEKHPAGEESDDSNTSGNSSSQPRATPRIATPTPVPSPGAWMFKDYKGALDQKPTPKHR